MVKVFYLIKGPVRAVVAFLQEVDNQSTNDVLAGYLLVKTGYRETDKPTALGEHKARTDNLTMKT